MRVLEFLPAERPINTPVTKFGGYPAWIAGPQWPHSRSTGRPMRFICQVALPESARRGEQQMAYIFFTDPDQGEEFVDGTWEPEGGENAVILQPAPFTPVVECKPLEYGPCLMIGEDKAPTIMQRVRGVRPRRTFRPIEYAVREKDVPDDEEHALTSRMGGQPTWLQNEETPADGPWHLIVQIDSTFQGFDLNFGDSGVGYAFVHDRGDRARFLWQCC